MHTNYLVKTNDSIKSRSDILVMTNLQAYLFDLMAIKGHCEADPTIITKFFVPFRALTAGSHVLCTSTLSRPPPPAHCARRCCCHPFPLLTEHLR